MLVTDAGSEGRNHGLVRSLRPHKEVSERIGGKKLAILEITRRGAVSLAQTITVETMNLNSPILESMRRTAD